MCILRDFFYCVVNIVICCCYGDDGFEKEEKEDISYESNIVWI